MYSRNIPSGTTSIDEKKTWRRGPFEIAKEFKLPIQTFRINYTPLRPAAFIDQDWFLTHLHQIRKHKISASLFFDQPQAKKMGP